MEEERGTRDDMRKFHKRENGKEEGLSGGLDKSKARGGLVEPILSTTCRPAKNFSAHPQASQVPDNRGT